MSTTASQTNYAPDVPAHGPAADEIVSAVNDLTIITNTPPLGLTMDQGILLD